MGSSDGGGQSGQFPNKMRHFCLWVINFVVCVHAHQYFFLHHAPLFNLIDKITQKDCLWVRAVDPIGLKESNLLGYCHV